MRLGFILLLSIIIIGLSACAPKRLPPEVVVQTVTVNHYPEYPSLKPLPPLNLQAFEWDYPRNLSEWIPKSKSKCLDVPDEERDKAYWERCGENPKIISNIFLGMDQKNFNIFVTNWEKLRERIKMYKARIVEVNRQREQWRQKAEQERKKDKVAGAPASTIEPKAPETNKVNEVKQPDNPKSKTEGATIEDSNLNEKEKSILSRILSKQSLNSDRELIALKSSVNE